MTTPLLILKDETCRPVVGFEGRCVINERGHIWRIGPRGGWIRLRHHIVKGYRRVSLGGEQYSVHRLVAAAFIGPCPEGKEVNHIDGKKWNNHVSNLEYVTRKENIHHARRTGLQKYAHGRRHGTNTHPESYRGERNARATLTDEKVRQIRALAPTLKYRVIAEMFGTTTANVEEIVARRTWKHVKGVGHA